MTLELLYSMRRKPLKCEPPILGNSLDPAVPRPIVKISVENIIAFSSLTELEDSDGDTWGGHVYVCDIDTPWESHKVTSTVHPISAMEWDGEGHQLAVCTRFGEVSVFTQKDNLLNSWTCLYSTNFPGDHILSCIFFHSGRHVILTDKKLDAPITDRIQVARSQPTAKGFGGTPLQGLCVVTATGVTATITMEANNNVAVSPQQRNNITTIVANTHRDTVMAAALAHSNGKILLATLVSSGARASILSHKPHSVTPLTTLMTDTKGCTSITWCQRDDGDYLVIAGPSVTMWKLTEKAHPVHKLLSKGPVQGSTTPGGGPKPIDCFTTLTWTQISWWRVENPSLSVAAYNNLNAALAVSCSANAIHVLKEGHALCSKIVNTENEISAPIGTPPKKMKYGHGQITPTPPTLQSVCVSAIGNAVVCVDSRSQLHVLVYLPPPDATLPAIVQQITTSLHYSAVSGYDCLSVLLKLKPAIAEAVYECVTESFQRQSASYQQYYYNNYMKIRIAICKTVGTMTRVYSWLRCSQSVLSCWAQVLTSMASDKYDHEDDKNLWTTEIEWSSTNVQALRPLLSRAVNIAYTVIAALLHHNHTSHEYTLWMDPLSLSTLRKLTAVAACYRGSGRIPEPLPRLLAKLPQAVHSTEFLEECAALSSIPTTHVWESLPRCNVTSPHGTNPPFFLSLSSPPASLKYMSSPPSAAHCDLATITATDAIRYTYLGGGGSSCRHCGRCGARSLANTAFCRCGGHWTLISNV